MARSARVADDEEDDFQSMVSINAGISAFTKMYQINELHQTEYFKNLLPYSEKRVEEIAQSMRTGGYDLSQPIHYWIEGQTIIDGNTRYEAAVRAKLYQVPVYEHHFNTQEEAALHAIGWQLSRRNLTPADMLSIIDKYMEMGGKRLLSDIRKELVEKLNISDRQVQRLMAIAKDEEARNAVNEGTSISQAYDDYMDRKHPKEEIQEEESDSLDEENIDSDDVKDTGIVENNESNKPSGQEDYEDYEGYAAEKRNNSKSTMNSSFSSSDEYSSEDYEEEDDDSSERDSSDNKNPSVSDGHADSSSSQGKTEIVHGKPDIKDDPAYGSYTYQQADMKEYEYSEGWYNCMECVIGLLKEGHTIEDIWGYFYPDGKKMEPAEIRSFNIGTKEKKAFLEFHNTMKSSCQGC